MKDLIEALIIMSKYITDENGLRNPTFCSHDLLEVMVDPALVSEEDLARLKCLGFYPNDDSDGFKSYRFGSC